MERRSEALRPARRKEGAGNGEIVCDAAKAEGHAHEHRTLSQPLKSNNQKLLILITNVYQWFSVEGGST
jgi:NAD(P)H-dependent flavin oxidoreductase YrpB (nitropropane dioxygenase family)